MAGIDELRAVRALLWDARVLLADTGFVARGAYARDSRGFNVSGHAVHARSWCARGAVQAQALGSWTAEKAEERLSIAAADADSEEEYGMVTVINDRLGLSGALRIYDRAIANVDRDIAAADERESTAMYVGASGVLRGTAAFDAQPGAVRPS